MAINIVIFASGSGTNAEALVSHFSQLDQFHVRAIFSNRKDAFVLQRAEKLGVPAEVFSKAELTQPNFLRRLSAYDADYILLAGFLLKVPDYLIEAFPDRIINIHPALLPAYGGKGMYGDRVHAAVIANGEAHSGITIHLVNENYDEGRILFQASCKVLADDTPESLAQKIHTLEHQYFPKIVVDYILDHRA